MTYLLEVGFKVSKTKCDAIAHGQYNNEKPICVLQDVLMKVESFNFLEDLMILDSGVYFDVPIILRRLLLANGCAFVNMEKGKMKFQLNYEKVNHIVE